MGRPKKIYTPIKDRLTPENLARTLEIARKVYHSFDEVKEALDKYHDIPNHKRRDIYIVDADKSLYLLGANAHEVSHTVLTDHYKATVSKYREKKTDALSAHREKLKDLGTQIDEKKSFLALLDAKPSEDLRLLEVRRMVAESLAAVQAVYDAHYEHLKHISTLSPELAERAEKRDNRKLAYAAKDLPETVPVFISAPRPPEAGDVFLLPPRDSEYETPQV